MMFSCCHPRLPEEAALMSLHAARLPARLDSAGGLSPLFDQDRSRWDTRLATQGWSSSNARPRERT